MGYWAESHIAGGVAHLIDRRLATRQRTEHISPMPSQKDWYRISQSLDGQQEALISCFGTAMQAPLRVLPSTEASTDAAA